MKGFLLSLDALFAISLLAMVSLFLIGFSYTHTSPDLKYQRFYYAGKDLANVFEEMKLEAVEFLPVVQSYLDSGILKPQDLNRTILDIIGSFWAEGNKSHAENLTKDIITNVTNNTAYKYEILLNNESIYKSSSEEPEFLTRLTTIVSGYERTKPVDGYVAKVYLTKVRKTTSSFIYFGGYVGDGNITRFITLPSDANVSNVYLEMNVGNNFSLFINDEFAGTYNKTSSNFSADNWTVCSESINPSYCSYFTGGNNLIEINFTSSEDNYIGGGYLKVTYLTSELSSDYLVNETLAEDYYRFPGINGVINLYSSFYVPGTLNSLFAYLHYLNNIPNMTIFLTLGNATIYESNATEEQNVTINNTELNSTLVSSGLSYPYLSDRTVPLRFGSRMLTTIMQGNADVILITDLSGSMNWQLDNDAVGVERDCDDPNLYNSDTKRISLAKCLDKEFVEIVLNSSGNRVGLVGFYGDADPPYRGRTISYDLSTDKESLNDEIDNYFTQDGTCICCAINRAYNILQEQSNASRRKFIVVMSDGIPTHQCGTSGVDECQGTRDGSPGNEGLWLGWGAGCYGGTDDCDTNDCLCAMQNANWSACRLHNDLDVTIDSIGFGPVADCWSANWTLQAIASCGNGSYYASANATQLEEIYQTIAENIVNVSYQAQTMIIEGVGAMNNTLYPDSYIQFNYTPSAKSLSYGEITLTYESPRLRESTGEDLITNETTGAKEGKFFIPDVDDVFDAKITSYSSIYWTDRLWVNSSNTNGWERIYWLGNYSDDYIMLGDPYIIHIPPNYLKPGENNSVMIGTGLSPENGTGGSPDDRVIYTIGITGVGLRSYSDVFPKAKGSTVTVYYDMNGDNEADGSDLIQIGTDPGDIFDPQNDSVDDAFMKLLDNLNFDFNDLNPNGYGDGSQLNPYDGVNQTNPIDLEITSEVSFTSDYISQIPSLWGPAELEIRVWS
jgi:hypothetical protein